MVTRAQQTDSKGQPADSVGEAVRLNDLLCMARVYEVFGRGSVDLRRAKWAKRSWLRGLPRIGCRLVVLQGRRRRRETWWLS